jgi:hypothetical protein
LFAPSDAAPIAYIAGVTGPLIGADLMHLKEIEQSAGGWPASAGRGLSTVSSFRESSRLISHDFRCPGGAELRAQPPHPALRKPSSMWA